MAGKNSTTEPPMHVQCNLWGVFPSQKIFWIFFSNVRLVDVQFHLWGVFPSQKNSRELYGSLPKNTYTTLRIWSTHKTEKRLASPSGNRTPVSRVTSGDTHHYTNEDRYIKILVIFSSANFCTSRHLPMVSLTTPCYPPLRSDGQKESGLPVGSA